MTITVRSETDLIHSVPFTLGFTPANSVVFLALREAVVHFSGRFDLPPRGEASTVARHIVRVLDHHQVHRACLVTYADIPGPARALTRSLSDELVRLGIESPRALVVWGSRWSHSDCPPSCCPPRGRPLPSPQDSRVVAEFVFSGRATRGDRGALVAEAAPDERFLGAFGVLSRRQRLVPVEADHLWRDLATVGTSVRTSLGSTVGTSVGTSAGTSAGTSVAFDPSAPHVLAMARSLLDRDWRDALLSRLCPGLFPTDEIPGEAARRARAALTQRPWLCSGTGSRFDQSESSQQARLAEVSLQARLLVVARRSPPPLSAGTYTVAAVVAGWGGDGALANVALDCALRADPGYRLAQLVSTALNAGILPNRFTNDKANARGEEARAPRGEVGRTPREEVGRTPREEVCRAPREDDGRAPRERDARTG